MRPRFEVTVPEEGLPRVLDRFAAQECERLPVLGDLESRRLVGTISKRDILSVYSLDSSRGARGAGRPGRSRPRSRRSSTRCRCPWASKAARSQSRASGTRTLSPCCW